MSSYRESIIGEESDPELEFIQDAAPPAPLMGSQGNYVYDELEEADPGPYHFWSPGEEISLADMYMGLPRINPCLIETLENQMPWCDIRYLEGATGKRRTSIDPETRRPDGFVEAQYTIHASANRATLLNSYGPGSPNPRGLIEITTFSKIEGRRIGLAKLNQTLQPRPVLFGQVPEDLEQEVRVSGALGVRERFVLEARTFFGSPEFVGQASVKLQRLYLGAIEEILQAFHSYRRIANAYMDAQDAALELPDSNDKSKDTYDDRDYHLMWLLARPQVKVAQARMIAAAGSGGGLTGEQLSAILATAGQGAGSGISAEQIAAIVSQTVLATVKAIQSQEKGAQEPKATAKRVSRSKA